MIKIDFSWRKEDLKYIEKMPKSFRESMIKSMREVAFMGEAEAKKGFLSGHGAPHPTILTARTGHLRRSIKSGIDNDGAYLATSVAYGFKHEIDPGARPFLAPGFTDNMDKVEDIILKNILKGMD